MKSTRDEIRDILAARGGVTVASIASDLSMNQANIRRHLEVMRAEGLVDVEMQRHGLGRPSYLYRLTERAEELTGHYPRLLNRMVRRIAALPDGGGPELLAQVFDGVADDIASTYAPRVNGGSVAERVAQTSDALKDEGIVDHWRREDDGFHLMNTTCPYRKAAELTDAPCHADHRTVELLVGAPVQQISRMVDGHAMCEYVVQPNEVAPARKPRSRAKAS